MLKLCLTFDDYCNHYFSRIHPTSTLTSTCQFYLRLGDYSLSKLCEVVLGKALNKDCQMSDWEAVKLSPSQIDYAALDAHCLLGLLDVMLDRLGIRWESSISNGRGIPHGIGVRGKYNVPGYTFGRRQQNTEVKKKTESQTNINDCGFFDSSKIRRYCESIDIEEMAIERETIERKKKFKEEEQRKREETKRGKTNEVEKNVTKGATKEKETGTESKTKTVTETETVTEGGMEIPSVGINVPADMKEEKKVNAEIHEEKETKRGKKQKRKKNMNKGATKEKETGTASKAATETETEGGMEIPSVSINVPTDMKDEKKESQKANHKIEMEKERRTKQSEQSRMRNEIRN